MYIIDVHHPAFYEIRPRHRHQTLGLRCLNTFYPILHRKGKSQVSDQTHPRRIIHHMISIVFFGSSGILHTIHTVWVCTSQHMLEKRDHRIISYKHLIYYMRNVLIMVVRCLEDTALIHRLRNDYIPLTVCPLSNIKLNVFDNMKSHSIKQLLNAGLKMYPSIPMIPPTLVV